MRQVISDTRVPIKLWLDDIEAGALTQAVNLTELPFVFKHIAVMPDAHQGYGMPIGGVMATQGAVVPNAVGVDIGCGMCAVKSSLMETDPERLRKVMGRIRAIIPVGFAHHKTQQEWEGFTRAPSIPIVLGELQAAKYQLGTLGGGNHFMEIQLEPGADGGVWLMLHSGSRNFGLKIAKTYHEIARELCEKWHSNIPNQDLAFLPIDTQEAQEYMLAMEYALQFALESRTRMMQHMMAALTEEFDAEPFGAILNVHHNYARMENHFGSNVLVHRKGATSARDGELGIIPGSQGTASYIVRGLGNKESFESCSHGAGRKLSRARARKELNLKHEVARLDEAGIIHGIRHESDLDEAAGAYKDIDTVIKNQYDLVKVEAVLRPLAVIKA